MSNPYIAVDWGTSSFRAYHVDAGSKVINQFADAEGILSVKDKAFEAVLESHIGDWDKSLPVIASGMITRLDRSAICRLPRWPKRFGQSASLSPA
jgi:2-keto-3-deoxy-galactonokinase